MTKKESLFKALSTNFTEITSLEKQRCKFDTSNYVFAVKATLIADSITYRGKNTEAIKRHPQLKTISDIEADGLTFIFCLPSEIKNPLYANQLLIPDIYDYNFTMHRMENKWCHYLGRKGKLCLERNPIEFFYRNYKPTEHSTQEEIMEKYIDTILFPYIYIFEFFHRTREMVEPEWNNHVYLKYDDLENYIEG